MFSHGRFDNQHLSLSASGLGIVPGTNLTGVDRLPAIYRGPVRMLSSNLFRCLTFFCVAASCCVTGFAGPPGYWQAPGVHIPRSQYQAPIVDYYSGQQPQLWDNEQPVEHLLGELGKRSWMRFEYLHWSFARPGSVSVGAPVLNLTDPLQVVDNLDNGAAAGVGIIPSLGNMGLDDTPGVRGTWGLDLKDAEFELQFFGTGESEDAFSFNNLSAFRPTTLDPVTGLAIPATLGTVDRPNIVIPLLSDGAAADAATANYLIYDGSFSAKITSQMWGAEASLMTKSYIAGPGLSWQWLGGFRYLSYDEQYSHVGVNLNNGLAPITTGIGGRTKNNMYGPEVGARASVTNQWFTLSATPRIAFTLNDYSAQTDASTSETAFARTIVGDQSGIEFTPIVQLSFTGEIHVTPNVSLYGGYDFMWIYRMTRPFDNIRYDSTAGAIQAFDTAITQEIDLESFYARGLSFGCVVRY